MTDTLDAGTGGSIEALLEQLALDYHKTVEGEYGCGYPQSQCPGVLRLIKLLQSAAALLTRRDHPEPAYWRCRTCGCLWRDNHDGSVSLGSAKQTSCDVCETKPTPDVCEPLWTQVTRRDQPDPQDDRERWTGAELLSRARELAQEHKARRDQPALPKCPACGHAWHDSSCGEVLAPSEVPAFPLKCGCIAHEDRSATRRDAPQEQHEDKDHTRGQPVTIPSAGSTASTGRGNSMCSKCDDKGAYGVTEPAETRAFPDGSKLVIGPGYSTHLCACRKDLPVREGKATWWSLEQVYGEDVAIPIFDETFSITVSAEVPISEDNYRVQRRGNRYYPTLINIECPRDMTLHSGTARSLARALIAAAEAAEKIDDADTDRRCARWGPRECSELAKVADAVDPQVGEPPPDHARFEKGFMSSEINDLGRDADPAKEPGVIENLKNALEKFIEASQLPETCVHDAEPDYCDGCRYAMEKAMQMARIHARAALETIPAAPPVAAKEPEPQ